MNQLSRPDNGLAERAANHLGAGRLSEAESGCRRILAERPDDGAALRMLGVIAYRSGQPDAARRLIEKAIAENPLDGEAQHALGQVLMQMGKGGAAIHAFEAALSITPRNIGAILNLSTLKRLGGDTDGALEFLLPALVRDNASPDILNEIGICHLHAGRAEAAAEWLARAVRLAPASAIYRNHLALALEGTGEPEAAIGEYDRALEIDPNHSEAGWNRTVALMALGRYAQGLKGWHLRRGHRSYRARAIQLPEWDGKQLDEGRLLVYAEQGLGDQILYAALLPLIAASAPALTLEAEPRLVPLFARSFSGTEVIAAAASPGPEVTSPKTVARHSIVDLARELPGAAETILPAAGYLQPDGPRRDEFRARLQAFGPPPYVGISWRSGADGNGAPKSIDLHRWRKILLQGPATFVNLQYGNTDEDINKAERLTGARIYTDLDLDRFADLDGLAALIGALDQIITTSNITPMIAGAIGVPCWIMLRKSPFWYWGLAGDQAPFFASVRCYRQETAGEWDSVIERVAQDFRRVTNRRRV